MEELVGLLNRVLDRFTGRAERLRLQELARRVSDVPLDAAKMAVTRLLSDSSRYTCTRTKPSTSELTALKVVGPVCQTFFAEYVSVRERYGDMFLARSRIQRSPLAPELVRVGEDEEFGELATEPATDSVYLVWNDASAGEPRVRYPSIYHVLLDGAAMRGDYEPPSSNSPPAS